MEHLAIVHEHSNEPTGEILPRHEAIKQKAWRRSTNVFVLNSEGHVLVHQRSMQKDTYPGVWSTHMGGHVTQDETYETNALKELEEEAGIKKQQTEIIPFRVTKITRSCLWAKDFATIHDAELHELVPQPGEIDQFKWMTLEEIIEESKKAPEKWFAGVNDLRVEYYCIRAALTTAHELGVMTTPKAMHTWHPIPHMI